MKPGSKKQRGRKQSAKALRPLFLKTHAHICICMCNPAHFSVCICTALGRNVKGSNATPSGSLPRRSPLFFPHQPFVTASRVKLNSTEGRAKRTITTALSCYPGPGSSSSVRPVIIHLLVLSSPWPALVDCTAAPQLAVLCSGRRLSRNKHQFREARTDTHTHDHD